MKSLNHTSQIAKMKAVKAVNITEKATEVASDRGLSTDELLKNYAPSSVFFTEDWTMTKPDNSHLTYYELETYITPTDCQ